MQLWITIHLQPHLIDQMLAHITSSMKSTASVNVPMKRFHPRHQSPDCDGKLKLVQRTANRAYKVWKSARKTRNQDHPIRILQGFQTEIQSTTQKTPQIPVDLFFSELDLNITDSRKLFRKIRNYNRQPSVPRTLPVNLTQRCYLRR